MRNLRTLFTLAVACGLSIQAAAAQDESTRAASIDAVLAEVQAGIDAAQKALDAQDTCNGRCPRLKDVTVTLEAVLKRTKDTGFRFLIFSFGRKFEEAQIQIIELNLKPPPPAAGQSALREPLSSLLAHAIIDAVQGVQRAEKHQSSPLLLNTFSVELSFVVNVESSGGAKDLKVSILPIDIDFKNSRQLSKGNTHKVKVVFERPPDPSA